jgi:branched-chain amino acid transport system ATP-binding protein
MLRIEHLTKTFDGFLAVDKASLTVEKGDVMAVIGPNGAGKTTLFHLVTGQIVPTSGAIYFKGQDITGLTPNQVCRKGISRSYQVVNIFNRLTVFENVQVAVLSHRRQTFNLFRPAKTMAVKETRQILDSVGLLGKESMLSGTLSHGDQKVLEIAIALGNRPELLILDEPTAGMSPEETEGTLRLMKQLSGEMGITILFCEHDMGMVFSIASQIMVMQAGQSIIQGPPDTVRNNPQVRKAYLGGSESCSR